LKTPKFVHPVFKAAPRRIGPYKRCSALPSNVFEQKSERF
jgi:hypothetical protein